MSEDYAKGFKDGFAVGLEEGKKLVPKDTVFQPSYSKSISVGIGCYKCGKNYIDCGICYVHDCPIRISSVDISKPATGDFY